MSNVNELKRFLADKAPGTKLELATSQYASNTTKPGHTFDFHTTAQAVRSLIKQDWVKGECRWRYYEVEVLARPRFTRHGTTAEKKLERAYQMVLTAREMIADLADDIDATEKEADDLGTFADALADAKDAFDIS